MSREKALFKNTIILAIGTFLPRVINLVTTPIILSFTTESEYGFIEFVTSMILSLVVPVCTLQLEQALFRFLIDAKTDKERRRIISTGYSLITVILLVVGILTLLIPINGFNNMYKFLLVGYIWIEIMAQIAKFVLRAFAMYKQYSTFAALACISNFAVVCLCFFVFKTDYMGMIIALTVADVIAVVYAIFSAPILQYYHPKYFDYKTMNQMLRYALPFIPNMISWYINTLSDKWFIVMILGTSANGLYAYANKIPSIINILYPTFNLAWTESATRSVNDTDSDTYYSKMFKMIFCILSGGTACVLAATPYMLPLLRGTKTNYDVASVYVPALIIATYFYCFAQFFSSIYIAKKESKNMSITTCLAAIVNIVINLLAIRYIGLLAAVVASLASNFLLAGYRYMDINKRHYRMRVNRRLTGLSVVILGICCMLCWLNSGIANILNIIIAVGYTYFICGDIFIPIIKSKVKRG